MLLSAALIVKNEERFLAQCLQSIRELVDEIVVVDTGSTDRTREIARKYGARLHDFTWIDNFAAARNHAMDLALGEWILYIDADERVRPCSPDRLRAQLSNPSNVAHYVLLHPRPGFTPYWELRLFRNDPRIRFRGIIHENIWPGIHDYRKTKGGRIGRSGLVFDHEGYEGDQGHKHLRNLPLLRKALRKEPDRVFSWCHLATIYLALGKDRSAEKAWKAGLDVVKKTGGFRAEDSLPYMGLIQWRFERGRAIEPLLQEALRRFPHNLQLHWLRGRTLMSAGRFAEAIVVFERLISCGQRGDFDHSMAYDTRLLNILPYECLATCHFRLGKYSNSRKYFELAATHDPDKLEYRVKAALCSRLQGSPSSRPGVTSPVV
jgi:glycosyltransferase involved in cell wall biosynthesis